ncbi:16S rRNA (uracil(1498)-N(3))-methyltransferase [Nostocoides australiense]|nr:16S rRNA (uracil(1498)-N(3))-methyltransferase [Actinomycetota bacterium]MCB1301027.1 16S rRNA (uracil(1498)-N(3))-methyltransferase [Tetrasphaera sp.]
MTLPLFLTDPGDLAAARAGSAYVLGGAEGRHAATVKRLRAGEQLMVGDGAGRQITGSVIEAAGNEVTMSVEQVTDEPPPVPSITLVQALAKGERDEAAIEAATEYGVDRIVPWQAERSIVQWRGERAEKSRSKWVDVVTAAAKQSRRAFVPPVEQLVDTSQLPRRIGQATVAFILHEEAVLPLAAQPIPGAGEIIIIVGPEGGISPGELATLSSAGGIPVRLGSTVLRSSSAGPAAIAVLSADERWR